MTELAPICCGRPARLTTGRDIYPHRQDLAHKHFYKCDRCFAYCGCHPGTTKPLGTPADKATRKARSKFHDQVFDPIWKTAIEACGYTPENEKARRRIISKARGRLYAYLAHHLELPSGKCHTGSFTVELCERATEILRGVTYNHVREWCGKQRDKAKEAAHV